MAKSGLGSPLMQAQDPYHTFSEDLQERLERLRVDLGDWNSLLTSTNTATNVGFQTKDSTIRKSLGLARKKLKMVRVTIAGVEKNRAKFDYIDDEELESRKEFVDRSTAQLDEIQEELDAPSSKQKLDRDKKAAEKVRSQTSADAAGSSNRYTRSHGRFMGDQREAQATVMHDQEQHLEAIEGSVVRLEEHARAIHTELGEQDTLIDDLDKDVDDAQGNLDRAMQLIQTLLDTKDNCTLCSIAILVIILLVLAIVAFS